MKQVLITTAAVIWALLAAVSVPVNAAETTTVAGTVLKTDVDVDVYQEASETSAVTAALDAGTAVLVTDDDAGEGWCRIQVRETTGYIKSAHLVPLVSSEEMDLEFEQIGNNYHMVFNE
ncbi:MAG: SH3 domain-containing protein, partial [Lachnospiraceae bacterium]|nr:SH3 domain-containing protein [Lachnospiraceae bacterium]